MSWNTAPERKKLRKVRPQRLPDNWMRKTQQGQRDNQKLPCNIYREKTHAGAVGGAARGERPPGCVGTTAGRRTARGGGDARGGKTRRERERREGGKKGKRGGWRGKAESGRTAQEEQRQRRWNCRVKAQKPAQEPSEELSLQECSAAWWLPPGRR